MTTQIMMKQIAGTLHSGGSDADKVAKIMPHVSAILAILGLNLEEDGVRETPSRVAKMYVTETFRGLDPARKPRMALFENTSGYREMVVAKGITFFSSCEHHLVPFFGTAHVAYFPKEYLAGLSKLNRLVQYIANKPQTQERLTMEIGAELTEALGTEDVAVALEATHLCITSRGIRDTKSITRTYHFGGMFEIKELKEDFLHQIKS